MRLLDWKVTARMQSPFIRVYKEERQLNLILIVDLSASNDFGTQALSKKEMIIELSSVLAALAIKNNDKVGLAIISDQVEKFIPSKQGKAHVFRLIKELYTFKPKSPKTNLKNCLQKLCKLIPNHSVVFLVSDFIDHNNDYDKELKILAQTQDLIAISVRDPREFDLPNIGYMELVDPESNKKTLLNLNRKSTRENFSIKQKQHLENTKNKFKKLGIDFLELNTSKAYIQKLLGLFIKRERRR
jgi:uncharacterized protein (DUF58 family)